MRAGLLLCGAALALTSVWAYAQGAPESLLPPGFDDPAPAPAPAPARTSAPAPSAAPARSPGTSSSPVVQPLPGAGLASASGDSGGAALDDSLLAKLPTMEELEVMTPEELEEALGLEPSADMPAAARRSLEQVGIIDQREGGFRSTSLARQNASLVRALLSKNRGALVSRWGHILLRRALASRLDAPVGMRPADFAALRAALLLRMGEAEAARAMVQDVDLGNFTPALTNAALNSYAANADFTGICPAMMTRAGDRDDPKWDVAGSICSAFRGDENYAMQRLDRALSRGTMPRIDLLLAQKYAGAAGRSRQAVTIEWDGVEDMNPWRYGLTLAVGLEPPERLMEGSGWRYDATAALAPMLGLTRRAQAADRAAGVGVLSASAMVDLYSQIYATEDVTGEWAERAEKLRNAYVAGEPSARLVSMQELWNEGGGQLERYSRMVLTAFAAARLPVDSTYRDSAPNLIASMLAAGLDRNALRWAEVAETGSLSWALLAVSAPVRSNPVDDGLLDSFVDDDDSFESRKSAFLLAGLAGLARVTPDTAGKFSDRLGVELDRKSKWTTMIDTAAERNNPALVALLAGLGMQGGSWDKMTPRYLFHIVSALRKVGLEAEARMIAAEAVARG